MGVYDLNPEEILVDNPIVKAGFDEQAANLNEKVDRENKRNEKRNKRSLTQRIVDRALPKQKEYFIPGALPGFGLRVRPSGHKSYVFVYKSPGKRFCRYSIGNAKAMSLDDAYDEALELSSKIREGENPQEERRQKKNFTLNDFFHQYVSEHVRTNLSKSWGKEVERIYSSFVMESLGECSVADIKRRDLMDRIQRGSTPNVKRSIRAVMSAFYAWGVDMGYVDENILTGSKRYSRLKSRDRVLTDRELWAVWISTFELNSPWGEFGRFVILTGQRRSEVAKLHWQEIDLEQKIWNLPAQRTKNRHNHSIPLTPMMLKALEGTKNNSGFVFASIRDTNIPISGFSKVAKRWKKEANLYDWRLHDLRRTVASNMGKIGIAPHVIEAVLGHRTGVISGLSAIYNRHKYEEEKRDALTRWNDYLMEVLSKEYEPFPDPDVEIEL